MYLLMLLQLIFNITLFICTALQIRKVFRETANAISKGDSRRFNRMEADKDRYLGINISEDRFQLTYSVPSLDLGFI